VDINKCIACGLCAEKCPRKVDDEYNQGLGKRKAIHVQYPQAVPLKYCIDAENCIFFEKGKCKACEKFCPAGAINFEDTEKELTLKVGSIVLCPGFETYDPGIHDTYGYKRSSNIVTSLEFERILASSGPYGGHLVRPSDDKEPDKIAWIQCVGSRDVHDGANPFCSSACCTHAVKEALVAKDHKKGTLDTAIFYIDVRTFGKDYERYYNRAKDKEGVRFIKSKVATIAENNDTGNLLVRYTDETGARAEEEFDLVVLSVGYAVSQNAADLAQRIGIDLDTHRFPESDTFVPVQTSRPGIFVAGCFHSPKDIPSSVIDASAAAASAGALLSEARFTRSKIKELPPEIPPAEIMGQRPRVGVFVCKCGTNIAGVVDVPQVADYAKSLPFVEHVDQNLFSCSQDTQEQITQAIKEHQLNRVVVASCTPQTHEALFQETVRNAGINKYLFEMANIRNQCSWVHANFPEQATEKAKDLVRMAVEKVTLLEPLTELELEVNQAALVIGGGVAGMAAARNLSSQGYATYLVERTNALGGNALKLFTTWKGEDIVSNTRSLIDAVHTDERITVFLNAEITHVEGFVGNFTTTIRTNDTQEHTLTHGVTIIATGAQELVPDEYHYGTNPKVITSLELDQRFQQQDPALTDINTCVFIQCVGSRIPERPYCSKVCCTHSVVSALHLKELNPQMNVVVLHRDMRTYGLREEVYREARERGVVFVRYDNERDLVVDEDSGQLSVRFTDFALRRELQIRPDLLVLAAATVPRDENFLAQQFKIPLNEDGFFVEAHVKLRPVDFAVDGVFLCGLAHSPKSVDESIAQAQAAAARAVSLLAKKTILTSGTIAVVNPLYCSSCGVCVAVCPFKAPALNEKTGIAEINPVLCKGCGLCVASCRSGAIHLNGFDEGQIMRMIGEVSA
jgi:heterodisulfide reductase subunit A